MKIQKSDRQKLIRSMVGGRSGYCAASTIKPTLAIEFGSATFNTNSLLLDYQRNPIDLNNPSKRLKGDMLHFRSHDEHNGHKPLWSMTAMLENWEYSLLISNHSTRKAGAQFEFDVAYSFSEALLEGVEFDPLKFEILTEIFDDTLIKFNGGEKCAATPPSSLFDYSNL